MTAPDTAALRALDLDAILARAVTSKVHARLKSDVVLEATLLDLDALVTAYRDAADEVERTRGRIAEPYRTLGEERDDARAERDASRTAIDAVLALHRPGVPDRSGRAECKECFDTHPCRTVAGITDTSGGASCARWGHAWLNDGAIPLVCEACGHVDGAAITDALGGGT